MTSAGHHWVFNHWQLNFLFKNIQANNKVNKISTLTHCDHSLVDPPHEGPVMHKAFPCHALVMMWVPIYIYIFPFWLWRRHLLSVPFWLYDVGTFSLVVCLRDTYSPVCYRSCIDSMAGLLMCPRQTGLHCQGNLHQERDLKISSKGATFNQVQPGGHVHRNIVFPGIWTLTVKIRHCETKLSF